MLLALCCFVFSSVLVGLFANWTADPPDGPPSDLAAIGYFCAVIVLLASTLAVVVYLALWAVL